MPRSATCSRTTTTIAACRVSWVIDTPTSASHRSGSGRGEADRRAGQSIQVAEWPGRPRMMPAGDVYGGGSPNGERVLRERRAAASWEGQLYAADAAERDLLLPAGAEGRRVRAQPQDPDDVERQSKYADPTSSVATTRRRARWKRCSGRLISRSAPTAHSTSATRSTRESRAPGFRRHAVERDTDRAEEVHVEGAHVRCGHHRRADHGPALAGRRRARDRLRSAQGEGASASDAVAALPGSSPGTFAAGPSPPGIEMGPEDSSARAHPSRSRIQS